MRFYTLEKNGTRFPAVSFDGGKSAYALKMLGFDCDDLNSFICSDVDANLAKLAEISKHELSVQCFDLENIKICAPIPMPRQDLVCLGINYSEHAKEAGKFSDEAFGGERPYTIYFTKHAAYCTGTGDVIPSYQGYVEGLDYESELGVVLKDDVRSVSVEEAESHIFGYTVINDVSARNLQTRHKQWLIGKSLDGFSPMGPCIVTPDEIGDAKNLKISSTVNGEIRQNSNTCYMIQTVAGAIADLSTGMTLLAGTIIATGTPAGVGMGFTPPKFLVPGDEVVCEIENIGRLVNVIE